MKRITTLLAAFGFVMFVACDAGTDETETEPGAIVADDTAGIGEPLEPSPVGSALSLRTDTLEGAGAYLTDGQGRALYVLEGEEDEITCIDACADAWPPLLAEEGQASAAAPGLDESLLGTIERPDGQRQVTYGGHPLYYYSQDSGPGTTMGQDVEDEWGEWYLVTPEGEHLEEGSSENEGS